MWNKSALSSFVRGCPLEPKDEVTVALVPKAGWLVPKAGPLDPKGGALVPNVD